MAIRGNYLIEKRNALNEIRANGMSLQELRFFSIYLSKINPRDIRTRVVRFSLVDFQRIMEFGSHLKISYIKNVTNSLLCKIVNVPTDRGGYEGFQLFTRCKVDMDDSGEWYVEIDAHDQALPLMFQFKERYFTYELWNALRLKSSNQLRMYEILKQYENVGERVITISELKELLGISKDEYQRYGDFKTHVLDVCQKALEDSTDIKYTYEPFGKKGRGGKIQSIKFNIKKNSGFIDQLTLYDFITRQVVSDIRIDDEEEIEHEDHFSQEILQFLSEACDNVFNISEMQVLYDMAIKIVPPRKENDWQLEIFDYLKRKYNELKWRASTTSIKSHMGYLKKIIEADMR